MIELLVPENIKMMPVTHIYIDYWARLYNVKVNTYDGRLIWIGGVGDTLVWQWPTVEHKIGGRMVDSLYIDARAKVYLNTIPGKDSPEYMKTIFPSFFFGRDPHKLEALSKNYLEYHDRTVRSVFVGKIHNSVQEKFRSVDYSVVIEVFKVARGLGRYQYPLSQSDFYELLRKAKFSLSLRGYGEKCFREIESLALGSVLMVNDDVDTQGYWNPLQEGVHFLRYETSSDLISIQESTDLEAWMQISGNGLKWYEDNSTFLGALNVLNQIYEQIRSS